MTNTATRLECPFCSGKGKQPWFSHVANGDCFPCGATGFFLDRQSLRKAIDRRGHQLTSPKGDKVTVKAFGDKAQVLFESRTVNEPGCGMDFDTRDMTREEARQLWRELKGKGWA